MSSVMTYVPASGSVIEPPLAIRVPPIAGFWSWSVFPNTTFQSLLSIADWGATFQLLSPVTVTVIVKISPSVVVNGQLAAAEKSQVGRSPIR